MSDTDRTNGDVPPDDDAPDATDEARDDADGDSDAAAETPDAADGVADSAADDDAAADGDDDTPSAADDDADAPSLPRATAVSEIGLATALRRIDDSIGAFEQVLLVVFLLALIGVGAAQAVSTNLFNKSWLWSFEVIRYSVFFIAMTGAALSAQSERLIAMDFVTRMLKPMTRARLRQFLRLCTIAVCVLVIISSSALAEVLAKEPPGHFIDSDTGFLALPIGAGLIALHLILHIAVDLTYLLRNATPPEDTELHAH